MPQVTSSSLPFYLIPWLLLVVLTIALYRRQSYSVYPAFFIYTVFSALRTTFFIPVAFRYARTHSPTLYSIYYYAYWLSEPVGVVLIFIVIYRVFAAILAPYAALRRWTAVLYMLALAISLVIAIFVAPVEIKSRGVMSVAIPLWQASMLLRASLLVVLFLVLFGIGITVRDYLFGITAGFSVEAALPLVASSFHWSSFLWISHFHVLADFIAILIWLVYLFVPRKEPRVPGPLIAQGPDIPAWNDALSEFLDKP